MAQRQRDFAQSCVESGYADPSLKIGMQKLIESVLTQETSITALETQMDILIGQSHTQNTQRKRVSNHAAESSCNKWASEWEEYETKLILESFIESKAQAEKAAAPRRPTLTSSVISVARDYWEACTPPLSDAAELRSPDTSPCLGTPLRRSTGCSTPLSAPPAAAVTGYGVVCKMQARVRGKQLRKEWNMPMDDDIMTGKAHLQELVEKSLFAPWFDRGPIWSKDRLVDEQTTPEEPDWTSEWDSCWQEVQARDSLNLD